MKSRDAARRRSILKLKRRRSSREEDEREGERGRLSAAATQTPRARALTSRHAYVHALKKASTFAYSGGKRALLVKTGRCRQTRARQSAQSCRSARACVHMHVQGNGLFISEAKQKNRVT